MDQKKIRICVDARPLIHPSNGNARYLYQMLLHAAEERPGWEWFLISHRPLHPSYGDIFRNPRIHNLAPSTPAHLPGLFWMNLAVPGLVEKLGCDLFWGTLAMLPLFFRKRTRIPAMVNFHDLNSRVAPETMDRANRWQHRLLDGHVLKEATKVLCLSRTTLEDIRHFYPSIPPEQLVVVYPGCELPATQVEAPPPPAGKLKSFILSVGTIEPRKNLETPLAAYREIRSEHPELPPFLIVGRKGWGDDSLYRLLRSGELEREGVYFIDHASEGALRWCYTKALFLVFASLHEGFGLPVLEARQMGKNAILSDIPVFREVGGEARFVAPRDRTAWGQAILESVAKEGKGKGKNRREVLMDREFWSWKSRAGFLCDEMEGMLEIREDTGHTGHTGHAQPPSGKRGAPRRQQRK